MGRNSSNPLPRSAFAAAFSCLGFTCKANQFRSGTVSDECIFTMGCRSAADALPRSESQEKRTYVELFCWGIRSYRAELYVCQASKLPRRSEERRVGKECRS